MFSPGDILDTNTLPGTRWLRDGQEEELRTVGSVVFYWTLVTASWIDSATYSMFLLFKPHMLMRPLAIK